MIDKAVDSISKADIEALVSNAVPEDRTLEYKEQVPGNTDGDKKEFLADVTALANTLGGDLIFGVAEKRDSQNKPTGLPEKSEGLQIGNVDAEIRRLEGIILTGVAPRIAGIQIKPIDGFGKGPVLLLRVPHSWAAPHMVSVGGSSKFFARNSTGKYQLDVGQIRAAFVGGEGLSRKVAEFRAERIAKVLSGQMPVRLAERTLAILHILPFEAFEPFSRRNLSQEAFKRRVDLRPMATSGWDHRYNFDGFVTWGGGGQAGVPRSYVQLFNAGAFEAVADRMAISHEGKTRIFISDVEIEMIGVTQKCLRLLQDWSISSPVAIGITLSGIQNAVIPAGGVAWPEDPAPVDRDLLVVPEIVVEDISSAPATFLRPAFDALWQAAGYAGSKSYNAAGEWNPRR